MTSGLELNDKRFDHTALHAGRLKRVTEHFALICGHPDTRCPYQFLSGSD